MSNKKKNFKTGCDEKETEFLEIIKIIEMWAELQNERNFR